MLTYKTRVESTKLRCNKGLSALKAMASKGIEQRRHLSLLQPSVTDYGLSLTTLAQSNLLKLDTVHKTLFETMHYLLDLPSMETRYKVE